MGIQKQEFYEGAALHQLIRGSSGVDVIHFPPLFIINGSLQVHLKYSTAKRSPWGFTFMPEEQLLLKQRAQQMPLVIGLICGADGVATVPYEQFIRVAQLSKMALRVSCRRNYREHFEVVGPDGTLPNRVATSKWVRLIKCMRETMA